MREPSVAGAMRNEYVAIRKLPMGMGPVGLQAGFSAVRVLQRGPATLLNNQP